MRTSILGFLILMLAPVAALAQSDGPLGVGIVVAPENGIWSCAAANPDAAFTCARQKCRDAGETECYRINWCYPAGWGALYSARTADFHTPDAICGAPTRDEALATVERWCRAQEYRISCHVFRLLTPEGKEEEVEREFTFDR